MIGELLGRFHPLVVHLPVGILLLAFIMEIASRNKRFKHLSRALPFVLGLGILFSVVAWITGWIMPKEGTFDDRLVRFHFWSALSMTVGNVLVYLCLISKNKRVNRLYFPLFVLTILLLSVTGHYGGSLTHGEDHLTAPLTIAKKPKVLSSDSLQVYADVIAPILKQKCYSCHNQGKKKGGLIMSTEAGLLNGGDQGKIIVKGNSLTSPLMKRLHLPLDDKEHMPPRGKRQLTEDEINLLDWWITNGATFDQKVHQLEQSEIIQPILKKYVQGEHELDLSKLEILTDSDISALQSKGISVYRQSEKSPLLNVKLSRDSTLSSKKINQLKKLALHVNELDLSYSSVDDKMLSTLTRFKNLQVLKLQQTGVTSDGIKYLEELEHLHTLNLYGTSVDDDCLSFLDQLPSLKSLFTWQTKITSEAIAAFSDNHPNINIQAGVDKELFGKTELKGPYISADKNLFQDSTYVSMKATFPKVKIYYTQDGSEPDSLSTLYTEPILIDNTTSIKAICYKEGWSRSIVSEEVILKGSLPITKVSLSQKANPKYPGAGSATLTDEIVGSNVFSDKSWLGFYAEDLVITLTLDSMQTISSLVLGVLEDTGSYIFNPKAITVLTSANGVSYTKQISQNIPTTKEPKSSYHKPHLLSFDQHEAKYVKVQLEGLKKNPKWHNAPGADNWLFIDEVIVN